MSLAAQIPRVVLSGLYHPAWDILGPHEPTCITASSSSSSVALEMVRRPSDEPDRTSGGDEAEG